jgi:putative flavoprotein involved in K+ transport
METERQLHVIIIGAGPAGLGVAVCLARCGVPFTLLERGSSPLAGLRQIDPVMTLLSPTRLSRMPGMPLKKGTSGYLTFQELVNELHSYQRQHQVAVTTNAEVVSVEPGDQRFVVHYKDSTGRMHSLHGSHVINATGQISTPQLPAQFDPAQCSFPWLHSVKARASHLQNSRRLLVVGGGSSAAEVLENWLAVRRSEDRAWLALRSRLVALPHRILGLDIHYLGWLPEHIPIRIFGRRHLKIREPMLGRKVVRALKQGLITRLPSPSSYQDRQVLLPDNQRLEPDLVVFATGFRYAASHLGELVEYSPAGQPTVDACESTRAPGLYLLGLPQGRTFASHYLRGIARDAAYVAERIANERD